MCWYERDPERLVIERDLMARGTSAKLHNLDGKLTWVEDLVSAGTKQPYRLAIVYPKHFPHECPRAHVLFPDVTGAPHVLADGSLCLFSDPFRPGVKTTALVVRNRSVVWFLAYEVWKATGEWMAPAH
jgi:hypothetical protein